MRAGGNAENNLVKDLGSSLDEVRMAIMDGVKSAGIEYGGHGAMMLFLELGIIQNDVTDATLRVISHPGRAERSEPRQHVSGGVFYSRQILEWDLPTRYRDNHLDVAA